MKCPLFDLLRCALAMTTVLGAAGCDLAAVGTTSDYGVPATISAKRYPVVAVAGIA